jgi:ligand-binding sensor domain-containing protein
VAAVGYITAIAQDAQGFIWFGGASGLARYDGYNVQVYRQDDSQPGSLSNSYVNDLWLGRDDSLWVATRGGLNRFDASRNRFEHFSQPADNPRGQAVNDINSLLEDSYGNFWLGTRSGLTGMPTFVVRYSLNRLHFSSIALASESGIAVMRISLTAASWINTSAGLTATDPFDLLRTGTGSPAVLTPDHASNRVAMASSLRLMSFDIRDSSSIPPRTAWHPTAPLGKPANCRN